MVVDIQINPASLDWPQLRDEVLAAEADHFGAAWVFDHLAGRSLRGTGMLECFTTLGALAAATSTIELGTMVVNMSLREPAAVVAGAATAQRIARRPLFLGLGAGASPTSRWAAELLDSGVTPAAALGDRHYRVVRTVELARRMWDLDRPAELATYPRPDPAPALLVGVNSVALARIAGRLADGINVAWAHPRRAELLSAADAEADGRRFLRTAWLVNEPGIRQVDHPVHRAVEAAGIDRLILVHTPGRT
ncbi:MAG: LLM class flavin-dependent oxidoreductase [Acidimicrobiia bacterium]|nr:LLM class flavin-dependent oxidoreductase [Acidimicrobiia bacterium]MDH4363785.1 LLM class flavin-dependent oxidoreductase [Acidimicrobiia bacterium]MDH5289196.1 LLM class flavin-dependent oxidoreductase [Acidimicrobiia bacterium]